MRHLVFVLNFSLKSTFTMLNFYVSFYWRFLMSCKFQIFKFFQLKISTLVTFTQRNVYASVCVYDSLFSS